MGNRYSRSSGNTSNMETEQLAITTLRFLDLPPELRLAIYALTLCTDKSLHWIGPDASSDNTINSFFAGFSANLLGTRKECPRIKTRRLVSSYVSTTTALLFTCKTIYREAIELFYQNNTFVIQAMTIGFQPILRYQPFSSLVQRLCLQFQDNFDPYMEANDFLDLVDTSISSFLQNIIDYCPNLKNFTVCGIPHPGMVYRRAWLHETPVFNRDDDDSFH